MNSDTRKEAHILDETRRGRATLAQQAAHDRGDDWQTQGLYGNAPEWFKALDDDLQAMIGRYLWMGEIKSSFPLREHDLLNTMRDLAVEVMRFRETTIKVLKCLQKVSPADFVVHGTNSRNAVELARAFVLDALDGDA